MFSQKQWILFDLVLVILLLALVLNLTGIKFPSLGQALSTLDKQAPLCLAAWQGEQNIVTDLSRCCRDIQTLGCSKSAEKDPPWNCGTPNTVQYKLNNKAYYLCKHFWSS